MRNYLAKDWLPRSNFFWSLFFVCLFFCLGWADSWPELKQDKVEIKTLAAKFIQEKHLEVLESPLTAKGRLYFKAPDSLRWEYLEPIKSVMLFSDQEMHRYTQSAQGMQKSKGYGLPIMDTILAQISNWINGRFQHSKVFSATLSPEKKIVLTPKSKAMQNYIQKVVLFLSDSPGVIEQVFIYEDNNSYTKISFTDTALNQPLSAQVFEKESLD